MNTSPHGQRFEHQIPGLRPRSAPPARQQSLRQAPERRPGPEKPGAFFAPVGPRSGSRGLRSAASGLVLLTATVLLQAQTVTQTVTLQTGWNAVLLEVAPDDAAPAAVFTNLPVATVWTRSEPVSTAQFIQDPSEASFNEADWLRWAPGEPPFVNTLRAVPGGRPYLLRLTNGPAVWRVTGPPVVRPAAWAPDRYNLRSFPVDPAAAPTFQRFFGASPAHYDAAQDRPRGIYRLAGDGHWVLVGKQEVLSAGMAYWVYCQGASTFAAPLEIGVDGGQDLDFAQERERMALRLENVDPGWRTVTLRQLGAVVPGLLAYQRFNVSTGREWVDLPNPFVLTVTNGAARTLELAVRRSHLPGPHYGTVLEVTDGQGTRHRLPLTVERLGQGYAGLWVGTVSVKAVSEPHFGSLTTNLYANVDGTPTSLDNPGLIVTTNLVVTTNANEVLVTNSLLQVRTADGRPVPVYERVERTAAAPTPTPTKSEFSLRVLIHVDTEHQARLLKEVVQLWRDGTVTTNAQGFRIVDQPGSYVLVTRDNLLGQFKGSVVREGVSVGRRLSAIGFDFDGRGTNDLALAGRFGPGHTLSGRISLEPDYPINPFRHKYHPDHDNLNAEFAPLTNSPNAESYAVTRQITFEFPVSGASGANDLDPGYTTVEGLYRETLTGLHKQPIHVQGTFRLSRASHIAELNPTPAP